MSGSNDTDNAPSKGIENGSNGHVPDMPEAARTRLLKRIEDVAAVDQIGFNAMMLDKIGRQNYLNEQLAKHQLRQAGVDLSETESDDMPWAGVSAGNEFHYHMEGGQQSSPPQKPNGSTASKWAPWMLAALGIPAAAGSAWLFSQPSVDTDTSNVVGASGGRQIEK